jgi:hypothetical protein
VGPFRKSIRSFNKLQILRLEKLTGKLKHRV